MTKISIAKDFTTTPGFRFKIEGPFSGEEFRETHLEPLFEKGETNIEVNLDGTAGYATSFLEEIFGGLSRKHGAARCLSVFSFISEEEPELVDEIQGYINDASK